MFKPVQVVEVYLAGSRVGKIALAPERHCLFEYDPEWVRTGFSISPFYLPLKSGVFIARDEPFDGLFGVFNDSLPDGWGRLLIDRWLASQGISPATLTILDRLCLVGSNGMGALTYSPDYTLKSAEKKHQLSFYAERVAEEKSQGSLSWLDPSGIDFLGVRSPPGTFPAA